MPSVTYNIPWTARIIGNQFDQDDLLIQNASQSTSRLEISASMYSLYNYASWNFTATRSLMENGRMAIGNIIQFDFFPDVDVVSFQFAILSFINGPGSNTAYMGETYEVSLVSPWYFQQIIKSKAYMGGVGSIVTQVISDELSTSFSKFDNIITTSDNPQTIRYRTLQTPGRFFEDRLTSAMRGTNDTTPFIYTNLKNEFELIDTSSISTSLPFIGVSIHNARLASYQESLNDSVLYKQFLFPDAMMLSVNNGPSKQLWHLANPGMLFLYHSDGSVNNVGDYPILQSLTHDVTNPYVLVSATNPGLLTKVYSDDSFNNYGDIVSEIINTYSKDLIDSFSFNMVCSLNLWVDVGRLFIPDILQEDDVTPSQFSGQKFLTRSVSHIFQGTRGSTHVELSIPALTYAKVEDVKNLFHQ